MVRRSMTMTPEATEAGLAADFLHNGYVGPYALLSIDESCSLERTILSHFNRNEFSVLKTGRNRHLDWKPIAALCRMGNLIKPLQELLGRDLLLWRTQIFYQGTERALPWHRDTYANLLEGSGPSLSLHVAISPARESNCVALIPGSHRDEDTSVFGLQEEPGAAAYGNTRFMSIGEPPAEKKMTLKRGEFFIFHPRLIHRTCYREDPTGSSRLAFALRVIAPDVRAMPAAFSDVPASRRGVVVLAGEDTHRLSQPAKWPQ